LSHRAACKHFTEHWLRRCKSALATLSWIYTSTKWAVRGMTQSAAAEFGQRKIRVNCVLPGFIDTDIITANPPQVNE
jgi:NAD(P)-dependent dehydrogenase (short-subunit alcohol dehydrogenase family)